MNNYDFLLERKRRRSLFIVEGDHEKNEMIHLLLRIFPKINIKEEDILIYGTNIYMLYEDIETEYTEEWDMVDVDLPYIVSKKKKYEKTLNKDDFNNIVLIFDYERHDPNFSEEKIAKLQYYFCDSTDVGKLYINYPMVEAYQHFDKWPCAEYAEIFVSASLNPGAKYKGIVKESFVAKLVNLPIKLNKILEERFHIEDFSVREDCVNKILSLSDVENMHWKVREILNPVLSGKDLSTAEYQMVDILSKYEFCNIKQTYLSYMKRVFSAIIIQSICKARKVCGDAYNVPMEELQAAFYTLDLGEVLKKQNICSRDIQNGIIWVLNTSVLFVPDYNFELLEG